MAKIGAYNTLQVVKKVDFGVYLDGKEHGEILLPSRYVPKQCEPGDTIEVFIYFDSDDRLIATTERPSAVVGSVAWLEVVEVNAFGAFLEWGLPKHILVPFTEQHPQMRRGRSYLVYVYLDNRKGRIVASSRLNKFLNAVPTDLKKNQQVDLTIGDKTDLGYKAVINNSSWGVIYHTEIFQPIQTGQQIQGFVKSIRADGKIDLCLQMPGYDKIAEVSEQIIAKLQAHDGFLSVTDASPPERIYRLFGVSKKTFKKAIGALYKSRRITLQNDGITLT